MNPRITLWIIIGALFVFALFVTFKAGSGGIETAQTATTLAKTTAQSYGGMVGGC